MRLHQLGLQAPHALQLPGHLLFQGCLILLHVLLAVSQLCLIFAVQCLKLAPASQKPGAEMRHTDQVAHLICLSDAVRCSSRRSQSSYQTPAIRLQTSLPSLKASKGLLLLQGCLE